MRCDSDFLPTHKPYPVDMGMRTKMESPGNGEYDGKYLLTIPA